MTAEPNASAAGAGGAGEDEKEEFKCYIGRVPTKFTEEIVQRILVEKMGGEVTPDETGVQTPVVEKVELIYPHEDDDENANTIDNNNNNSDVYRADRNRRSKNHGDTENSLLKEHRGFGFVLFATAEHRDAALNLETVRGGRKKTSKKLHTMYLRPYVAKTYDDDDDAATERQDGDEADTGPGRDICYLWNLKRCPYGENCKFRHVGEGGCVQQEKDLSPEEQKRLQRKRKGKCFTYKKKGTCSKGEDCPFSHDFQPDIDNNKDATICALVVLAKSEKDCINWKTKGKCRKGDKCVYKHDPQLQKSAFDKIAKKKRRREEGGGVDNDIEDHKSNKKKRRDEKQPLSVRVFGLNYDTTEADLKEWIETNAGHPVQSIIFPRFEDSNRSKGYCGVYFASPKAAKAAVDTCDSAELHGRWLRVQTGKSMTIDEWEGLHQSERTE
jgi:RNA recognition motif-containing protein